MTRHEDDLLAVAVGDDDIAFRDLLVRLRPQLHAHCVLAGGLALQAAGLVWIAVIAAPDVGYAALVLPLVVSGIGASMAIPVVQSAMLGAVAPHEVGKASGANNMTGTRRRVRRRASGGGVHHRGQAEQVDPGRPQRYARQMRRVLVGMASVYLLFAVIGRFVEGMGAVECGCAPSCWCKKPVLSTFRWVFPVGHQGGEGCS